MFKVFIAHKQKYSGEKLERALGSTFALFCIQQPFIHNSSYVDRRDCNCDSERVTSANLVLVFSPESDYLMVRASSIVSKSRQQKKMLVAWIYLVYVILEAAEMKSADPMSMMVSATRASSYGTWYRSWNYLAYAWNCLRTSIKGLQGSTLAAAKLINLLFFIFYIADIAALSE